MPMLDDKTLITPTLLKRFVIEARMDGGTGQHYGCIYRSNGDLCVHHPGSPAASPEQVMFAGDMLKRLNRELHHDGAWCMVFTHPKPLAEGFAIFSSPHADYSRYVFLWLDPDGDVQIPIEWKENESELLDFADVLSAGCLAHMGCCEQAWMDWKMHMRDVLEPREGEIFKEAQGQRPPSMRN